MYHSINSTAQYKTSATRFEGRVSKCHQSFDYSNVTTVVLLSVLLITNVLL